MLHLLLYGVLAVALAAGLFALAARYLPAGEQIAPPLRDEPPWELPPDRSLTAEEVDAVRLPVALRGYRFAETDVLLDRLAAELRARDAVIARLLGHPVGDTGSDAAAAAIDAPSVDLFKPPAEDDDQLAEELAIDEELRDTDEPVEGTSAQPPAAEPTEAPADAADETTSQPPAADPTQAPADSAGETAADPTQAPADSAGETAADPTEAPAESTEETSTVPPPPLVEPAVSRWAAAPPPWAVGSAPLQSGPPRGAGAQEGSSEFPPPPGQPEEGRRGRRRRRK